MQPNFQIAHHYASHGSQMLTVELCAYGVALQRLEHRV